MINTPVGWLAVSEKDGAIVRLDWSDGPGPDDPCSGEDDGAFTPVLAQARVQLEAYFAGTLETFDLPLAPKGGELHQKVFAAMSAIPYGRTRTYGEIANDLGTFGQPVGQACGANPIPIIIPCHRVLSAEGLGGYSGDGGLDTKIALLKLEGGYPFLV